LIHSLSESNFKNHEESVMFQKLKDRFALLRKLKSETS